MMRPRFLLILALAVVLLAAAWWSLRGRTLPLGIHTLNAEDAALQEAESAGAQYTLQVFPWRDIEPTRGEFHWEYTDWLVRAADYYHLHIIARLDQVPRWAAPGSTGLNAPPDNPDDYADFAAAVAARYRGRVAGYIIWNEPNLAREWGDQPPDPAGYGELLKRSAARLHSADPGAHIAAAALAPTNENSDRAMDDRVFLRRLYAEGGGAAFDILAAHPYPFAHPPGDPRGADGGLNFRRIEDWRDIMAANGDTAKPIWITEFGYPVETTPADAALRVSEAEQAVWTAEAYELARNEMPYVGLFTVWNLTRQPFAQNDQAGYSLVRANGTERPAFAALQSTEKESPAAA
ncbi:MAG: hypothetical protein ACM3JD_17190, partial [Rudaea sp.]